MRLRTLPALAAIATLACSSRSTTEPKPSGSAAAVGARPATHDACKGRDVVTFVVASDTHFGASDAVEQRDREAIAQMNTLEGKPWPDAIGGAIGAPCGVFVTGDLTEDGKTWEWEKFVKAFGRDGRDGALRVPVFEMLGNHDKHEGDYVRERIAERHGGATYSLDWGPAHLVVLSDGPADADLDWLDRDLAAAPPGAHVFLFLHYALEGRWSTGHWFGDGPHRDRLHQRIEKRAIAGIFHGHDHASGNYTWRGLDVYRTGSPKHASHTFDVVEVTKTGLKVAAWDYTNRAWVAWHAKGLGPGGAGAREVRQGAPLAR